MSIKKSLAWMGLAQGISFVLQFVASVVLARYLSPYEMGIFAVAVATTAMLSVIQHLGLNSLIVREENLTEDVSSTAFTINALIAVGLSLAIVVFAHAGAAFLRDDGVREVLLVLAVVPLFGILSFLPGANLERSGRFRDISFIWTLGNIVSAVVSMTLAVLGFSYMSIAYSSVVSAAAYAIMFIIAGRRHFAVRLGLKAWRRVGDFGFQMLAVAGLTTFSQRLSEILLGRILGLGALGLYNRASGLNQLLWNNIHLIVGGVILVDYSALHRQGVPLAERFKQTIAMATGTLWPAFAGLAVIAQPFIVIVYGERWAPAATPLVLLAIASMILVAIATSREVFTATGQVRAQTRVEAIRAPLSLLLFVAACTVSLEAAAAARIADALFAVFLYRPHLKRMTGAPLREFRGIYARSALVTVFAVLPAGLLMAFGGTQRFSLPPLLGAIMLGMIFWGAGLFLLKHPLANEISLTFRNRFPRLVSR